MAFLNYTWDQCQAIGQHLALRPSLVKFTWLGLLVVRCFDPAEGQKMDTYD
jgi:hypothetical protein